MNVGELMAKLAKLPPDMPVVVAQEDEPLGVYGLADVSVERMKRDDYWGSREVWDGEGHYASTPDPRVEVCYLDTDEPIRQIIDADVVEHRAAIESYDRDTRTLAAADQARAELAAPGRDAFVTMPAVLAELDAAISRCAVCNGPAPHGVLCRQCRTVLDRPPR